MYSDVKIGVSRKEYFRSQDNNIAPLRASEIVILNNSFYFRRDSAGDDESSGYSSLSPSTVFMNLYGSYFSGH